ncbi:hypothetical protein [Rhizorhabdus histidinilytica]|uniref:hypothetical protein n=1 Tax=Rhizorhabdus histidinilytica TaxID=439228 RepID=UPI0032202E9C
MVRIWAQTELFGRLLCPDFVASRSRDFDENTEFTPARLDGLTGGKRADPIVTGHGIEVRSPASAVAGAGTDRAIGSMGGLAGIHGHWQHGHFRKIDWIEESHGLVDGGTILEILGMMAFLSIK